MQIFMARWKFERLTAGLSPIERARLAETVVFYPEGDEPTWHVDRDRIAGAFARLLAEQPLPLIPSRMSAWLLCPRAWGKTARDPIPPWKPVGPRAWMAPGGTAEPEVFSWSGPRRPEHHVSPIDWLTLDDVLAEFLEPDQPATRYFLNDRTPAAAADPLADILSWIARRRELDSRPRRTLLRAGDLVIAALRVVAAKPSGRTQPWEPKAADLAGIPIVPDRDLPPDVWRLVDPVSGEVLQEGSIADRGVRA